jgi:hypothetical protein
MKPRTILLGIGLFIVVIFCAAMKGYYEDAEEAEHQKTLDSMKKVENLERIYLEEDLNTARVRF